MTETRVAASANRWTWRDLLTVLAVGWFFGWVLTGWGFISENLLTKQDVGFTNLGWGYPMWVIPGVVTMLLIRKPGACLLGELIAGFVELLVIAFVIEETPRTTCSFAGADLYVLSGLLQGLGGELAFRLLRYRRWDAFAAAAAMCGSWWVGWLKGVHHTGCYSWSRPGLLFTATISCALAGLVLGAILGDLRLPEQKEPDDE